MLQIIKVEWQAPNIAVRAKQKSICQKNIHLCNDYHEIYENYSTENSYEIFEVESSYKQWQKFRMDGRGRAYVTDVVSGLKTSSRRSLFVLNTWMLRNIANCRKIFTCSMQSVLKGLMTSRFILEKKNAVDIAFAKFNALFFTFPKRIR